jgi:hypothetical protein
MGRESSPHWIQEESILGFGGEARRKEATRKTKTWIEELKWIVM